MRHLFVMDPLSSLNLRGDSTFVTMRECCDRGHAVSWCTPAVLYVQDGQAHARCTPVTVRAEPPHFVEQEPQALPLSGFDVVWMRKDPPFDLSYILATYQLDMAGTLVVNDPRGLKLFNEKLWAMAEFSRFQPKTLLTQDQRLLIRFVRDLEGRAVLKPWDGNGGRGVLVTSNADRNLPSMVEVLTANGTMAVIAQAYIDAVDQGDKRVLLFEGEPVGALLRVPQSGDYRANMHVGAKVEPVDLDARDREICQALGPRLRQWGQVFVGIDIIGGFLTEINVTSPTGIQEVNRMYGTRLEANLVDCVEQRARSRG